MIKRLRVHFSSGEVVCLCSNEHYKTCARRVRDGLECRDMMVSFVDVEENMIDEGEYMIDSSFSKTLSHLKRIIK